VTVVGEGFDRTSHCLFGDTTVKAQFLDAMTVRCISPPHAPASDIDFKVVIFNQTEGYNVSALGTPFGFSPPRTIAIQPSEGYVSGGEVVRVTGEYLTGAVSCRFGRYTVLAQQVNDTMVQCITPAVESSTVMPVEVLYGNSGASSGDTVFVFHPVVTTISPESGFILTSKQTVTFNGKGFIGDPTQCVFDGAEHVPATVISDVEIRCTVPLSNTPHTAEVYLTNSRQSQLGGQKFKYVYNHVIQDIHPAYGSTTGGTTVVVVGSGFSSATHCTFGSDRVQATIVSDMMVRCVSPYHAPGIVTFTVGSDSGDAETTFTSNPFEFNYKIMTTHVSSVYPTSGSTGGNALVTVRGSGFSLGSFCKFGDVEVEVIYLSPDHVACRTPVMTESKTVSLEVSQVGGGEGYSEDGHTYTFHANVSSVNKLEPDWGDEGEMVVVTGYNFSPESKCYFGGREATETTYVSEAQIKCVVPAVGTKSQEIVQVTSDPDHLPGGNVIFHYNIQQSNAETPAVREMSPAQGPTSGGTLVTVSGINFPEDCLCRFGDLFVEATYLSHTQVQCMSPQHRAATLVVEIVSADRTQFSSSYIRYTYQSASEMAPADIVDGGAAGEPGIERVSPSAARPGETINLIGELFSSVGHCAFFDTHTTQQVAANVVDSSHVTCEVPEPIAGFGPSVSVKYVSVNGLASRSLPFTFVV